MYSLDVGIENLFDNASHTTALPKLHFASVEDDTLWSWYISFMATCTQAVICQCSSLGHIEVEGKSYVILFSL